MPELVDTTCPSCGVRLDLSPLDQSLHGHDPRRCGTGRRMAAVPAGFGWQARPDLPFATGSVPVPAPHTGTVLPDWNAAGRAVAHLHAKPRQSWLRRLLRGV